MPSRSTRGKRAGPVANAHLPRVIQGGIVKRLLLFSGVIGAALAYFLDPASGKQRRERVVQRLHPNHTQESAEGVGLGLGR